MSVHESPDAEESRLGLSDRRGVAVEGMGLWSTMGKTLTAAALVFVTDMNDTLVHYNEAVERGFVLCRGL
jgi:hypothetical protein